MGRQIRTYLTADDSSKLRIELSQEFDVLFFDLKSKGFQLNPIPNPGSLIWDSREILFMARQQDRSSIRLEQFDPGWWAIDSLKSPVVEISKSYEGVETIGPGRLFYDYTYFDDGGKRVRKDEEFIKWAKTVFQFARKILNHIPDLDAYLGPKALNLYKNQQILFEEI